MAAAAARELAQKVVDHLNGAPSGTYSKSFSATRDYVVEFRANELTTLRVPVVPRELAIAFESRQNDQHDYEIDIGVLERVDLTDTSAVDVLMDLVQEIADYMRRTTFTLASGDRAIWSGLGNAPIYSQDHLREEGVFLSVITVTYRVLR